MSRATKAYDRLSFDGIFLVRIAQWITERRRSTSRNKLSELIPERDYAKLNQQDEELRLWVPEPVKLGLEKVSEQASLSLTAYLTEFFAAYLYGHYELLRMRGMDLGLYAPEEKPKLQGEVTRSQSCYSDLSDEPEINLGKNIFPLKILVPAKLKTALIKHATKSGLTLGEFVRAIISAHLFGQTYAPRPKGRPKADEARANKWEAEVPAAGDIPWT
jgi:hypothetical protein